VVSHGVSHSPFDIGRTVLAYRYALAGPTPAAPVLAQGKWAENVQPADGRSRADMDQRRWQPPPPRFSKYCWW
jgi:hypothetical protein